MTAPAPLIAPPPPEVLDRLKAAARPGGWSQEPERLAPKLTEWRGRWPGTTPLLLLPDSVERVAALVAICAETGTAITPQGGVTGLVGGSIPQGEVLLSLERMGAVRDVDAVDDVLVAEAGVTLDAAQAAAAQAGRRITLDLASSGSATLGGLVSTNAGGTGVLRHGAMRAQVLGLEAVLPDGAVFHGLKRLRKDNTGYDLKQLLIGAEGTLGVVTAVALRLSPPPANRAVALAAVDSPDAALRLLTLAKETAGPMIEAFELIGRQGLDFVLRNIPDQRDPFAAPHPWYVLVELASARAGAAEQALTPLLKQATEQGLLRDAVVAASDAQAAALWALREHQSAGQRTEGAAWKHDIAVPVSRTAEFIRRADAAVRTLAPDARIVAFGHLGDGNIHYDVVRPEGAPDDAHAALRDQGARVVHDLAHALGGSISAEHGLGAMKSAEALRYKDPAEVAAQRALRAALDPRRIMNPRVLF